LILNINSLQGTGDELDEGGGDDADDGAKWLGVVKDNVQKYLDLLPENLEKLKRVGAMLKNPLFRFLERECSVLSTLLQTVRNELQMVFEVCSG
jgi:dynein heavy chain 1